MTFGEMRRAAREHNWESVKSENGLLAYYVSQHLESPVGDRYDSHGRCPIPDHLDEEPSFRIEAERWVCSCTNTWGDLGDLIKRVESVSNSEALSQAVKLRDDYRDSGWEPPPGSVETGHTRKIDVATLEREVSEGQTVALASEYHDHDELVELLEIKGISGEVDRYRLIRTWRLGFQYGGCVVAPHYDENNEITGYKDRPSPTRHWNARSDSTFPALYGAWMDNGGEQVIVAEGETDTWLLWSLFTDEGWEVFGLPSGATPPRAEWVEMLADRRVVLAFDADEAGRQAARQWAKELRG